jgi:hypothetical protein
MDQLRNHFARSPTQSRNISTAVEWCCSGTVGQHECIDFFFLGWHGGVWSARALVQGASGSSEERRQKRNYWWKLIGACFPDTEPSYQTRSFMCFVCICGRSSCRSSTDSPPCPVRVHARRRSACPIRCMRACAWSLLIFDSVAAIWFLACMLAAYQTRSTGAEPSYETRSEFGAEFWRDRALIYTHIRLRVLMMWWIGHSYMYS